MKPTARSIDPTILEETQTALRRQGLHTVCEGAQCPNIGECWAKGHITLMILGDRCTRGCGFCGIVAKTPCPPDSGEPERVARAVANMNVRHVVITSVTRDDLPDGGAAHWAQTLQEVGRRRPRLAAQPTFTHVDSSGAASRDGVALPAPTLEALIPDFNGNVDAWQCIAKNFLLLSSELCVRTSETQNSEQGTQKEEVREPRPDILGHNLETVPRLYGTIRKGADYARSLSLLRFFTDCGLTTKTSLMAGLGETDDELIATLADARASGASIAYIGQYLAPTRRHEKVHRYLAPADFHRLRDRALALGFATVRAAPLLRSSTPAGIADYSKLP